MDAKRVDEYHKHGCNFYGKLVVVEYMEDLQKDPKWGAFNSGLSLDYAEKAKNLVRERQYNVKKELLALPAYVVEIA